MPGVILVFAKAPRPGLVKTRMCPPFSLEQAAQLYAHLLDDVLAATAEFARKLELEAVVTVHPADACREIAERCPADFRIVPQRGRSLGERMTWAAAEAAASGAEPILLRGSDSPVLDGDRVAALLDHLVRADVAICPDLDGGYSLIGMRRPVAGLFDHAMSTRSVLTDTLAIVSELGLRAEVIPGSFDLDTAADLIELAASRSRGDAILCPRLIDYLDEHDLWGEAAPRRGCPRGEPSGS
jgi:rSAM/selenodomain-associated transferase 1